MSLDEGINGTISYFKINIFPYKKNNLQQIGSKIEKKIESRKDIDILIIGGSQGSKTLNTRFLDQIEDLLNRLTKEKIKEFTIIHQTGMEDFHRVKRIASQYEAKFNFLKYSPEIFLGNIGDYYSRARLLISRAGASTISETKNFDLINILVPIKNSTNNHQYHNALEMNQKGLAEIWQENDQNLVLTNKIFNLLSKKDKAREILSNKKNQSNDYSAKNIVKEILKDG